MSTAAPPNLARASVEAGGTVAGVNAEAGGTEGVVESSSSQKVPLHVTLGSTSETHTGGEAAALGAGVTAPVDLGAGVTAPTAPTKALRRSSRNAATANVHALFKAERLQAKKNLEFPGNSFTSFPDSKISSNLGRIGINLGSSDIVAIKNLEVDRLILCANLKKSANKSKCSNTESDDERDNQLETILNHACGDLNENLLDAGNDQIIDLSPQRRRKKYNNAKNTNNGKLPKKPKTP